MDAEALVESALSQFETTLFPDVGSIQRATFDSDEEGSRTEDWEDLYTNLRIQLAAFFAASGSASESATGEVTTSIREQRAVIHADLADITEADRLAIGDRVFDIVGIERDGWGLVTTLRVDERESVEELGS